MEVETVQEEKLPLVQIDVADQELGLDMEWLESRTPHCVFGSVTCLHQDPLQQLADVQREVVQEDLSAAMDGMNP